MEEDEGADDSGKAVAAVWFDTLIHLLYQDLKAMNKWTAEDDEAQLQSRDSDGTAMYPAKNAGDGSDIEAVCTRFSDGTAPGMSSG